MAAYRGGRVATILSCVALALYVVGLGALIPTDHILVLQNETIFGKTTPSSYRRITTEVLDSIWRHVELSPAFALGLWLVPMIVATRVPLHAVTPVLRFLAIVFGSIMVFSLLLSKVGFCLSWNLIGGCFCFGFSKLKKKVLLHWREVGRWARKKESTSSSLPSVRTRSHPLWRIT